jgi:MFS family permease
VVDFLDFFGYNPFNILIYVLRASASTTVFLNKKATFLMNVYKVDQEYAGYFMSVVTLTYILGCIVFGHVRLSKRNLLMGGVLLSAITFFFQGPDYNFTKFDHKLWVVIAA